MTLAIASLQFTLYDASQILKRAILITGGAPFWKHCDNDFAKITVDGDTATLSWSEVWCGHPHDPCSELQSVDFPSELLLMSEDEIKAWKIDQHNKYEEREKQRAEQNYRRSPFDPPF